MSHGMTNDDQMYSVREAPWHMGMGTNVIMLESAPETRNERMVAAGHDFIVDEEPLYIGVESDRGELLDSQKLEGWRALLRSDTKNILHVARDSYEVVQNVVGHELFEALTQGASLDDGTGGTIHGGATCYLSARVDEPQQVKGDDSPVYPYVVLLWAHDGSAAVIARRTSVRPVCWNTISAGEFESKRAGRNYTFRHTANVLDRIEEAKAVITGAKNETAAFVELANELVDIHVNAETRKKFITTFIPKPEAEVISDQVIDNIMDARAKLEAIFDSPTIADAHRNTAYGLLEAGVEYLDHLRGYRNSDTYLGRTLLRDEPLKRKLVPMIRKLTV